MLSEWEWKWIPAIIIFGGPVIVFSVIAGVISIMWKLKTIRTAYCGKRGYETSTAAGKAASVAIKFARDTNHLRIYFCDRCDKWHMTKQ